MFCKNCGAEIDDAARFCPKCGTKLTDDVQAPAAATAEESQTRAEPAAPIQTEPARPLPVYADPIPPQTAPVQAATEPDQKPENKVLGIVFRVGYIIGIVGISLFLGIVIISAIAYGRIYMFDGYEFTAVLIGLSLILMMLGFCTVVAKIIVSYGFKKCKFHKKPIQRVFAIGLAALCLGCSIWGFVECASVNGKGSDGGTTGSTFSFYDLYTECGCASPWATVGYDYLNIDSNPYDFDSDSTLSTTYLSSACAAIQKVNAALDLPSYLYQEMLETRALDGRQTYSGGKVNVSWRYHPDSGLEVRYTR